ncbi:MAG TPA: XdhC family protein [Ilumatobacter sp.]|nr:XdhC family protein [Ilumatobacter sp.]
MSTGASTQARIEARISALTAARVPFVRATVVRAQFPTSAAPGDTAIVLGDGSMDGFVGGQCAETSVRIAAGDVLAAGEALLLRVLPDDANEFPDTPGARTVVNPCLSGGAVEIFLEPLLPAPLVTIVGTSPIAEALASLGKSISYEIARAAAVEVPEGTTAVLIATHGHDEEAWIRSALDAGVGFIGLIASPTRGAAVLAGLRLSDEERKRVHTPLGLWIGAKTADEIALSILAEIVKAIRLDGLRAGGAAPSPVAFGRSTPEPESRLETAIDPICGMTVVVGPDAPTATVADEQYWFCCTGCRDRMLAGTG